MLEGVGDCRCWHMLGDMVWSRCGQGTRTIGGAPRVGGTLARCGLGNFKPSTGEAEPRADSGVWVHAEQSGGVAACAVRRRRGSECVGRCR